MKGIVFTEFLEMVEDRFSPEIADRIIESSNLSSRGAYTSLGTYDHAEMVRLVSQLSAATGIAPPVLTHTFGKYLLAGSLLFTHKLLMALIHRMVYSKR